MFATCCLEFAEANLLTCASKGELITSWFGALANVCTDNATVQPSFTLLIGKEGSTICGYLVIGKPAVLTNQRTMRFSTIRIGRTGRGRSGQVW